MENSSAISEQSTEGQTPSSANTFFVGKVLPFNCWSSPLPVPSQLVPPHQDNSAAPELLLQPELWSPHLKSQNPIQKRKGCQNVIPATLSGYPVYSTKQGVPALWGVHGQQDVCQKCRCPGHTPNLRTRWTDRISEYGAGMCVNWPNFRVRCRNVRELTEFQSTVQECACLQSSWTFLMHLQFVNRCSQIIFHWSLGEIPLACLLPNINLRVHSHLRLFCFLSLHENILYLLKCYLCQEVYLKALPSPTWTDLFWSLSKWIFLTSHIWTT